MSDVKTSVKPTNTPADIRTPTDAKTSVKPTDSKITQIRGPISLVEYRSLVFNKHVYVFGEIHGEPPLCITKDPAMDVEDFIDSTIRSSSPHVVDLYLEKSFGKAMNYTVGDPGHYINRIYRKLRGLRKLDSGKYSHSNLRLHAVDVRQVMDSVASVAFFNNNIYNNMSYLLGEGKNPKNPIDIARIIIESIDLLFDDLKEDKSIDYKLFLKDKEFDKQLQSLDKGVLITLMLYMDMRTEEIDLTTEDMRDLKKICKLIMKKKAKDTAPRVIAYIHNKILDFLALFVDIYTMARIFRSFRKVPGQYSGDPDRIIIYLGDGHAKACREILEVLGFTMMSQTYASVEDYPQTPSTNGIPARSCVDISSFTQPFFTDTS